MENNRFGEIKIDSGSTSESTGPDVPLHPSIDDGEYAPPKELEVPPPVSEAKNYRYRQQRSPKNLIPMPSVKMVAWLSIIPLLVILYSVGSYFLVPMVIKGMLVPRLSEHVDRPVKIGRIVFSPFNLELFVDDVTVGSVQGDKTGKELLVSENARFQFSLGRIFDGILLCRHAVFDGVSVNLIRHKDTTVDLKMISNLFVSHSAERDVKNWPAWFILDEVKVTAGQVHIDDRLTRKVFAIEQIQFYLPSADTRERDKNVLPKLSAIIDSSPFEINAVRFRNQSGAWRTGFSFEFKKVIMDNFKELLPLPETGLLLSEGEADIKLDIILPENQHGTEGVVVEGEATLRSVRWHDPDAQTDLTLPSARIVYHVVPGVKRIRFTSVEFHEPELSLVEKKDAVPSERLASLAYVQSILNRLSFADDILKVENFLWNNGKVIMSRLGPAGSKTVWNDVTFSLSGFTTAGYRRVHSSETDSARYTFRARDISTKPATDIFSEGQLDAETILSGKLEITGLDLVRYPTLLPNSVISMQKGKADISMYYEYAGLSEQEQGNAFSRNKISNGTIKATGYVLARNHNKAVAGEMLTCRKFHFDMVSRTVVCDQLEIVKSEIFSDTIFGKETVNKKTGPHNWQFRVNDLQVRDSTIHIPIKGFASDKKNTSLVIQDVSLAAVSLQAEKVTDNVTASGRFGKKGKMTVRGNFSSRTRQGNMQIKIQDMDLSLLRPYFSSWFVPKLNKGVFAVNGSLQLPDRKFTGKVQIDDLDAGEESGARISWKHAFSDNCTYRSTPMSLELDELVVQQPSLKSGLSSGERPIDKYLRIQDEILPSSVRIGRIRVEDGGFELSEPIIYPGYQPLLGNIYGTLLPIDPANQRFSIKGKINGQGNFTLLGTSSKDSILSYRLDVQNFSFLPFDSILRKEAGFSGHQSVASWKQEMVPENNLSKVTTKIAVRNVVPDSASPYATLLSLIINEDHSFEMGMEGQYSNERPQPFLLEHLVNRLRHLEVKASISPHLVLKLIRPDLDLAQSVAFAPGSALLDKSVPLSGYQVLLKVRPFIMLGLQGQFDPVVDRDMLRAELQREADQKLEIENKRRAMEKVKILQREKRRLKELKAGGPGVVTEEINPNELSMDLQPLSRVMIQLDPSRLDDLARQRAQVLQDHLVNQLQLDPARIIIEKGVAKNTSGVDINILPLIPREKEKK